MRGKGKPLSGAALQVRITPAYAGKRGILDTDTKLLQDHPRLCGEKLIGEENAEKVLGSPPPMRGKVTFSITIWKYLGITPAYAGKSRQCTGFRQCTGDHPRLCGEKVCYGIPSVSQQGSPPPMRGKVYTAVKNAGDKRITPAYAGKRWLDIWRQCYREDHPRLCGEKPDRVVHFLCDLGSPPPMRGKDKI